MLDPNAHMRIQGLPEFWLRAREASSTILLLDYDGTLAPFHPDRMQAIPLDGVMPALATLNALDDMTVALVSGRPVAEIQELTGISDLVIAGTHGFELYRPDHRIQRIDPNPNLLEKLDMIEEIAVDTVGRELAERKIATVALHTRKLDDGQAAEAATGFRAAIQPLLSDALEVRDFDGGVEVRVRGRDKGVAILEMLHEMRPAELVVYIGDDETDEDAFRALKGRGVGIKVGSPDAPTDADGRLASCEDVLQLLNDWIEMERC
jgi:trehalose 6-phosphate phosphatase